MQPEELKRRIEAGEPLTIIDTRRKSAYDASGQRIPGALRMEVDEIPERVAEIPRSRPVVLYCT